MSHNDRGKENNQPERENRSPEQVLEQRLAYLDRRWDEFDYEQRMKLVFEIDREYREATEGARQSGITARPRGIRWAPSYPARITSRN